MFRNIKLTKAGLVLRRLGQLARKSGKRENEEEEEKEAAAKEDAVN